MNLRRLATWVWPWLLVVAVGLLAAWLRYGLIEPPALAHQCDGGHGPAWCSWRLLAVQGFLSYAYGDIALAAAAMALLWRHPVSAWLAAACGTLALVLYCPDAGALALLIGCLCLLRAQATRTHAVAQHPEHAQQTNS